MPELPSGLSLAISRHALFDHGGNWFTCPENHFWFWIPAPEMGLPPYDPDAEMLRVAQDAAVPQNREEAKRFIMVLEMGDDEKYGWRGDWLSLFPRYIELDDRDLAAWEAWLSRPQTDEFIDETIKECERLAEVSRHAVGYATYEKIGGENATPDEEGWLHARLKEPTPQN